MINNLHTTNSAGFFLSNNLEIIFNQLELEGLIKNFNTLQRENPEIPSVHGESQLTYAMRERTITWKTTSGGAKEFKLLMSDIHSLERRYGPNIINVLKSAFIARHHDTNNIHKQDLLKVLYNTAEDDLLSVREFEADNRQLMVQKTELESEVPEYKQKKHHSISAVERVDNKIAELQTSISNLEASIEGIEDKNECMAIYNDIEKKRIRIAKLSEDKQNGYMKMKKYLEEEIEKITNAIGDKKKLKGQRVLWEIILEHMEHPFDFSKPLTVSELTSIEQGNNFHRSGCLNEDIKKGFKETDKKFYDSLQEGQSLNSKLKVNTPAYRMDKGNIKSDLLRLPIAEILLQNPEDYTEINRILTINGKNALDFEFIDMFKISIDKSRRSEFFSNGELDLTAMRNKNRQRSEDIITGIRETLGRYYIKYQNNFDNMAIMFASERQDIGTELFQMCQS